MEPHLRSKDASKIWTLCNHHYVHLTHDFRLEHMATLDELKQMVMSLRVSELQVLLGYAGRNKHGRKHELLTKALHLLKAGCSPAVQMKIKELYRRRFPQKIMTPADLSIPNVHSSPMPATLSPSAIPQLAYDGHPATSPLLPVSLLGPKHELELPHLASALHPVHPDIKLQKLPFYDLLDELIKPTSLASDNSQRFRETCFAFALTPQQVQQISSSMDISGTKCDFTVQVQLRFCLSETSCPQEDHFPPNLCVKVNGKPCSLPGYLPPTKNGVEPKRPSRPINITSLVRLSTTVPNTIVVSWTAEIGRNYSMAVYLVKQLSSTVLLQRLRAKGIRNPDHSRALIKEKLTADPDSEIATTSLRVSLLCPLGKMRLTIPCRALTCSHLQCFDATLYIQMNEKKPTWVCPVCDKKAPYEHLIIDGLFMEILKCCTDCDEIQFKEDGSWAPMRSKKEIQEVTASYNGVDGCLSSSLDHQVSSHQQSSNKNKKVEVIDLTIDSSSEEEEEEEEEPSAKRTCPSVSPASPLNNKGILNLPHQASPVSRTPSLPAVDPSYINTSLIQDYRHPFHMTPMSYDLQGLDFFPFLSGDNQVRSSDYRKAVPFQSVGAEIRWPKVGFLEDLLPNELGVVILQIASVSFGSAALVNLGSVKTRDSFSFPFFFPEPSYVVGVSRVSILAEKFLGECMSLGEEGIYRATLPLYCILCPSWI
uniref:Protein inhibitor of activated STAT 1 n=1 Tax=Ornithorhynchus anatinus TaxID=9258 RepID=A0A6I8NZ52_ORNAN